MRKLPTAKKKLKGTLEKSRVLPEEVSFSVVSGIPKPPKYFGEIATREWNALIPELKQAGTLESVDLPQLRAYCWAQQIIEECAEQLKKEGYFVKFMNKAKQVNIVANPAFKMMKEATEKMMAVASRFGFDPVSRTRVAVSDGRLVSPGVKEKEGSHPFEDAVNNKPTLKIAK